MEKRCIYHYPGPIEDDPSVGSAVRPRMMLKAFENIGYKVDAVTGYGAARKEKIRQIKENIKAGVKYDFLYSESRNIPVMLAEEDHIPRHPFLDFSFLRFCKKNGIPIGFFLRDIHWKFPMFNDLILWKRVIEKVLFRYDLWNYRRLADRFYMPSKRIQQFCLQDFDISELPPGGAGAKDVLAERKIKVPEKGKLRIFYVGGTMGIYDISSLYDVVCRTKAAEMTICTSAEQWEAFSKSHGESGCDRIKVVHKTSSELGPYYKWCDVATFYVGYTSYASTAVPIKLMEYVSYGVPIIVAGGSPAADFVKKYDIGWVIDRDDERLQSLLEHLSEHPEEIQEKTRHVFGIVKDNTWECRAEQVRKDLCGA